MTTRLKVDLDGTLPRDLDERLHWCLRIMGVRVEWWSVRRTRRGWHVEVELRGRLHPWKVVALQAILGSDYRRETFNLRRVWNWRGLDSAARKHWNVLFTRKVHVVFSPEKHNAH